MPAHDIRNLCEMLVLGPSLGQLGHADGPNVGRLRRGDRPKGGIHSSLNSSGRFSAGSGRLWCAGNSVEIVLRHVMVMMVVMKVRVVSGRAGSSCLPEPGMP